MRKSIGTKVIPSTRMVSHGSFGANDVGTHASTMEFFVFDDEAGKGEIEWDIPSLEDTEHIYLTWDEEKNLTAYDGIASLPREAIKFLEEKGFKVGPDFR
jgi:hypothetical protein